MGTVVQLKNQINDSYFQLKDSVEDKLVLTEEKIKSKLASDVELVQKMTDYHIKTGGKRLRALLTLGAAKLCGYSKGSRDINLAACVELIHSATLMHDDVAASGGYLISCAGDEIYANSSSIIGSIGVIYSSFGFTELIKKIGVERRIHTAGKNKSTLDPFLEEKNEDIERLKKIQLDLHKDFIDVVEESRKSKLNKSEVELFSGEFWSGSKAKDLGLIDGIGDAHIILKEKFGDDVVIKKFEKSKSWLSQKLSSSSNQIDQLANILDERSIWQRYGF